MMCPLVIGLVFLPEEQSWDLFHWPICILWCQKFFRHQSSKRKDEKCLENLTLKYLLSLPESPAFEFWSIQSQKTFRARQRPSWPSPFVLDHWIPRWDSFRHGLFDEFQSWEEQRSRPRGRFLEKLRLFLKASNDNLLFLLRFWPGQDVHFCSEEAESLESTRCDIKLGGTCFESLCSPCNIRRWASNSSLRDKE